MNEKFNTLRKEYSEIIYRSYEIIDNEDSLVLKYKFEIPSLRVFEPTVTILKEYIKNNSINKDLLNQMVFKLGLVELISYYKCACPKKVVIEAGYLDDYEKDWFKKLFYNGLGEFLYTNKINVSEKELFEFVIKGEKIEISDVEYNGHGNLIPIGGGKDSIVTMKLLEGYDNDYFVINPKDVHMKCVENPFIVKRVIDKNLIELNGLGFLNGHTPFSAIVAFTSFIVAYLTNKKYIVLSNEGSANESTVIGTNINHQYSKTYEFENDFYMYTKKYYKIDIKYFSLLRPIKEIQIAGLFSKYSEYHEIFRSCNVGSKQNPWVWCASCPKCLFVYIMLEAFLSKDEVINIFGSNMLDNKSLENTFLELIGEKETKPFECVGTIEEVKYAMNKIVEKDDSYLCKLYKDNYYEEVDIELNKLYYDNNVPSEYLDILKGAIEDVH